MIAINNVQQTFRCADFLIILSVSKVARKKNLFSAFFQSFTEI